MPTLTPKMADFFIGEVRYLGFKTLSDAHTFLEKLPRGWGVIAGPYTEENLRSGLEPHNVLAVIRYEGY